MKGGVTERGCRGEGWVTEKGCRSEGRGDRERVWR